MVGGLRGALFLMSEVPLYPPLPIPGKKDSRFVYYSILSDVFE